MTLAQLLERKDARGRSKGRTRAGARAHSFAQVDHISGRESLPLVRFSAGGLLHRSRATSQALRFNSARLGSLFINSPHHRTGKFADVAHRHLKSLRSFVGFDAFEARARKGQSDCLIPTKRLPK